MDEITIEHRLTSLEEGQKKISDTLDEFFNNHFTDLAKTVGGIEKKLNARPSWLVSLVITTLVGLVVFFLTKQI